MNQAQALYLLQEIDLAINAQQARLTEIDQILGQDEHVTETEHAYQQAEAALVPWKTKVRDLELEIKGVTGKSSAGEQRLYSGTVTSPKELQDMQEEIATLKRRHSKLEDELLEAMIELEDRQARRDEASRELSTAREAWEAEQSDLVVEQEQLKHSLAELRVQRQAALQPVNADSLAVYEKLFRSKRGNVVSPLADSICKFCGVGQTTVVVQQVRQGHHLVHCANCGRILVLL